MRLIDVDKLNLVVRVPTQNNAVCKEIADQVGRQIVNAPTVDAIPVEWIEKHYLCADPSLYTTRDWVIENMLVDWKAGQRGQL